MPFYEFYCDQKNCKHREEVFLSMDQITSYKPNKCPKHNSTLVRSYEYSLGKMQNGTSVSEHDLLKEKQKQKKFRSRLHFKNTKLQTIKDPAERRHFEKKYSTDPVLKGLKGDHEKNKKKYG